VSVLLEKQFRHVSLTMELVWQGFGMGYQFVWGDAFRDPRATFPYSHPKSLHTKRLAVDLPAFRDGKYLTETKQYEPLGEVWESLGGTWGGRFDDGNHFSLEHDGMR